MKRIVKIALIVASVFVLLIAAAALILPRVMDPNRHKDRITALVKEKTGRELTLPGDISISVFPWLGAKIGAAELGNAEGFQAPVFARVEQVQVRMKLLPLLSRKVEADVVSVKGLTLNLERNKDGRTNWDDLTTTPPSPAADKPDASPAPASSAAVLAVGGIDIQDATVTWADRLAGTKVVVNHLFVNTSEVNLVDPVSMEIGFELDTGDMGLSASVETAGRASLDPNGQRYAINGLTFKADLRGGKIPGGSAKINAFGDAVFDAAAQKIDMDGIRFEASGLTLIPFIASAAIKTSGAANLATGSFDLKTLDATLILTEGEDRTSAHLAGAVRGNVKTKQVEMSDLVLELPELAMKGIQGKITASESGSARVDLGAGVFALERLALAGTLSGDAIPGKTMPVAVRLQLRGDLNRQSITMEPLQLDAAGIHATCRLIINQYAAAPQVKGALTITAPDLRDLLAYLPLTPPETADPKIFSSAEMSADFLAGADAVSIEKLELKTGDIALHASARAKDLSTNPAYTAAIQAETFNPRPLLSAFDMLPETTDPGAMSAVSFSASLSGSTDAVSVSSLKLRLDDTQIEGKADIAFPPAPAYAFDIRIDGIDADRYLPPSKTEPSPEKEAGRMATPGAAASALPMETLRGLNLNGNVSLGKLKITNLRLTDLNVRAGAKDGLLSLHPLTAGLYGGTYSGNVRLDSRGPTPRLELDEKLVKVRVGDLLNDLQGKAPVAGIADVEMKLTGSGADTNAIISTLDGNAAFRVTDGYVKGMDIVGRLCRTLSVASTGSLKTEDLVGSALQLLVQKAAGPEKAEADRTAFSEMGGSMIFTQGVGTSKDLMLKSPLVRVQGSGALDLSGRRLDCQATAALVKSCDGQGGKSFSELENYPIPVTITGPLYKLEVKPDLTAGILGILERGREKPSPARTDQQPDASPAKPVEKAVKDLLQDLLKKQ